MVHQEVAAGALINSHNYFNTSPSREPRQKFFTSYIELPSPTPSHNFLSTTTKIMKYIQTDQVLEVPEGVSVAIKARSIKVTGPRGELSKELKHIDVAFSKVNDNAIKITVHNGDRKHVAALRTVKSLIFNMITGVTKGYKYKMRYVYAHFPINVNVVKVDGQDYVEIRNFLGEKRVRQIKIFDGVTVEQSTNQKDELVLSGNSLEDVSQNAADIQQICRVRNKDIRKFLDGIYVSERGTIEND